MYYKKILMFLMIVSGIIIIVSYVNSGNCSKPKVVYRYIPRTFEEDRAEPVFVSRVFKKMFEAPSPWVYSLKNPDYTTLQNVNEFYVSQA